MYAGNHAIDMALDQLVQQQCKFFDHLADLVDPRYFYEEREPIDVRYLKKSARAATKRAFKEQYKKNKRIKLDPDAVKTTTQLQQQQQEQRESKGSEPGLGPSSLGQLHLSAGMYAHA